MTEKKSFQMYRSHRAALKALSDADRGKLMEALFAHEDGEDAELEEGALQCVYLLLCDRLDHDREKYEETCARNRANGKKGGRPSKSGEAPHAKTGGSLRNPKKPDTDTGTDIDTDTDTEKEGVLTRGCAPQTHTPVSKRRFQKPSLDEVAAYCAERGCGVDAQRFVDFYESKGWMVGKSPMSDWRASVRLWEQETRAAPTKPESKPMEYKYSEVI